MKIDRRSFLSFVVGAAGGTALSPIGAKLTDDSSIWSQMWPWTPVPPDGEYSHVKTTSTICPGCCGLDVRKVDQRAIKIDGAKGYPGNDGGVCNLCLSGLQMLYGPTRVKGPMKRVGERGQGQWRSISWDEAISEVAQKLGELRDQDKSNTLACISGTDRGTVAALLNRMLMVYGSPNFIRTPSAIDSYELTLQLMHGTQSSVGFDFENAGYVLSFGAGFLEGWGAAGRMFKAHSQWRDNNVKVVQIEPRLSITAAKSGHWIPATAGTESMLALAIAHVIIKEQLYNKAFIENHTNGFEAWKATVIAEFSPEQVTEKCGVSTLKITEIAREFATAKRPLAICGRGKGMTPGGLDEFMAVHALNALVGNLNQEGGVWAVAEPAHINWPDAQGDEKTTLGLQTDRIDGAGSIKYPFSRHLLNRLPEAMQKAGDNALQALLVYNANPLYSAPDVAAMRAAFEKIPFIVSFASHMDETAAFSDLILPNHTHLERYEDVPTPVTFNRPMIGLSVPVVKPQFNTRHTGDVVIQLAAALGNAVAAAFPWENYEACLEETLADKWETIQDKGYWVDAAYEPAPWDEAFSNTASGKFEFSNNPLPALLSPVEMQGDAGQYPLVMVPIDTMRLSAGAVANPPFLMKTVEETMLKGDDLMVEIHPQDADRLGLAEGRWAKLSTPLGEASVKIHRYEGIQPGLIGVPRGLGHSAYDDYLAGKGININELIGAVEDPASGHNAAWGIRAKLAKA